MNILYIDTTDNKKIKIKLNVGKEEFVKESEAFVKQSQVALPLVEELLQEAGINISSIDKIMVKNIKGSYTGLRVGTSIANALSFAILKPINQNDLGEQVIPEY